MSTIYSRINERKQALLHQTEALDISRELAIYDICLEIARGEDAERERWQRNMRDRYDAFTAMRNDINEMIGNMPSSESTLLKGPEMVHECVAVVEAVKAYVDRVNSALHGAECFIEQHYEPAIDSDYEILVEVRSALSRTRQPTEPKPAQGTGELVEAANEGLKVLEQIPDARRSKRHKCAIGKLRAALKEAKQ